MGLSTPVAPAMSHHGEVLLWGSSRKENSPHDVTSLPKAAVRVQGCLHIALSYLLSHLAPYQAAPLDPRIHSCHPILKAICSPKSSRIPGLQENWKCFELSTMCQAQSLTSGSTRELARAVFRVPGDHCCHGGPDSSCWQGDISQNFPRRWDS